MVEVTGPEHVAEARRLEQLAIRHFDHRDPDFTGVPLWQLTMQQAQMHATLSLTVATIDAAAHHGQSHVDYLGAWIEATS